MSEIALTYLSGASRFRPSTMIRAVIGRSIPVAAGSCGAGRVTVGHARNLEMKTRLRKGETRKACRGAGTIALFVKE